MVVVMTTDVQLVNQALQLIGTRTTVASLSEDSNEAIQANIAFASVRSEVLRTAPWGFAKKVIQGELWKFAPGTPEFALYSANAAQSQWVPDYPPPPWLYSYFYPEDCVMVRYVQGQQVGNPNNPVPIFPTTMPYMYNTVAGTVRFEIGMDYLDAGSGAGTAARAILTNAQSALVTYTLNAEDTGIWDSLFEDAFVSALAAKLVIALTGDKNLANLLIGRANAAIIQARASDGNEALTVLDWLPEWIKVREPMFEIGDPGSAPYPMGQAYSNPYSGQYMLLAMV